MKTSEMIAMLEKNPKLKFKRQCTGDIYELGEMAFLTVVGKSYCSANIRIDDDWTVVREPVPVWEAIKAFCDGKKVYCAFKNWNNEEQRFYLKDSDGWAFHGNLLTEGDWYIEDPAHE
jgi:hypothetical protein